MSPKPRPAPSPKRSAKSARKPLAKPPGIAEAVEWANAATVLEKGGSPWPEAFRRALGVLIKDEEDMSFLDPELDRILERALA